MALSKVVLDQQFAGEELVSAVDSHGHKAAAAMEEFLRPFLAEGEVLPDLALLQDLLVRRLRLVTENLVLVDDNHEVDVENSGPALLRRQAAAESLFLTIRHIRKVLKATCDAAVCKDVFGLERSLSRRPLTLLRQAQRVIAHIEAPGFNPPTLLVAGVAVDPRTWLEELAGPTNVLAQAYDETRRAKQKAHDSRTGKNLTLSSYRQAYGRSVRLFEAIYAYGGLQKLATKLRPSGRQAGQRAPEVPQGGQDSPGLEVVRDPAQGAPDEASA